MRRCPLRASRGRYKEKCLDFRISIRLFSVCFGLLLSANMAWAEPNAGDAPASSKSDVSGQNKEAAKKEEAKPPAGAIPDAKEKPILTKQR